MQRSRDKASGRMRQTASIWIVALIFPQLVAANDSEVYVRTYLIGVSELARTESQDSVQGYQMTIDLTDHTSVDIEEPPPACGESVYQVFEDRAMMNFSVLPLGSCSIANSSVTCATEYIEGYESMFLQLRYTHKQSEQVLLKLEILQRSSGGRSMSSIPGFSKEDKSLFLKTYADLRTAVRCE